MNTDDKSQKLYIPLVYPPMSQEMLDALDDAYTSMWKSDFISFNDKPNYQYKFSGFKESSPCAEVSVATEKPKPGHLWIQLREGEEYAA